MTPAAALLVWMAEALAIAALSAQRRGARFALILAIALLPYPYFVEAPAWVRLAFAIAAFWSAVRCADFAMEPAPARFGARLAHLFAIIDTRLVTRGPRHLPRERLVVVVLSLAILAAALFALAASDALAGPWHYALRWIAGAMLMFALFELVTAAFAVATALAGLRAPPVSDAPHRARSIAEFWSARWNRVVGGILRERVFAPLARRGARRALWATFAFSAAFHAYLVGAALGATPATLAAAAFFLLQPLLLGAERRLRIRRMPAQAQRAWTLGMLVLLSPLFVEPVLQVLDGVRS